MNFLVILRDIQVMCDRLRVRRQMINFYSRGSQRGPKTDCVILEQSHIPFKKVEKMNLPVTLSSMTEV